MSKASGRFRFRGSSWLAFWRPGWRRSAKVRVTAATRLLLARRSQPDEVARGVAIGLFFAFVGPPGIQILPAAAVAVFTRSSVLMAVACVFVSNPITMPFIYPIALWLGTMITNAPPLSAAPETPEGFWSIVTDWGRNARLVVNMAAGCLAMGSASAALSYPIAWWTWSKVLEERDRRREAKLAKAALADQVGAAAPPAASADAAEER